MSPHTNSQPSYPYVVRVLYRQKGKATLAFLLVLSAALGASALMQPGYRSEAVLFLRLGRENVALDPTATIGQGSAVVMPQTREDEINSVAAMLRSRRFLEEIVNVFGPEAILGQKDPGQPREPVTDIAANATFQQPDLWDRLSPWQEVSPYESAIAKLERRVWIEVPKRTNIITVGYDGPSPKLAQAVVQKLVELYMDQHARLHRPSASHSFFEEQSQQLQTRLQTAEDKLTELKNETGLASVDERRTTLLTRVGDLENQLLAASADLKVAETEVAALEGQLERIPPEQVAGRTSGFPNEGRDLMRAQLYALQLKEQELLSTYTPETREVKEIRRQIQEAQVLFQKEEDKRTQITQSLNRNYEELQRLLLVAQTRQATLQSRADKLQEHLTAAAADVKKLNGDEIPLARAERERALAEVSYRRYAENLEQARIDHAMELQRISNVSLVQPASFSTRAVRPDKTLNLGLGLLAALFAAGAVAFFFETFAARTVPANVTVPASVEQHVNAPALPAAARVNGNGLELSPAGRSHNEV